MAPLRGGSKKKRKVEKKGEEEALDSGYLLKSSYDWWDLLSRRINGNTSPLKGVDKFETFFNMSRRTFDYICSLAEEHVMVKSANYVYTNGKQMLLQEIVALALRRLSSGNSLISVGDLFGTHHSVVSQVTWRFVEAIEEKGLHHLHWPSSEQEISEIKSKFEKKTGVPNCCGTIDTTHITMMLSSSDQTADVWVDHEENHSMILQAIVGPDTRFLDIVTGLPGKMDETSVLQSSTFYKLCENRERLNGNKIKLSEETELGEYIVGDSAFPLRSWLMTPYHQQKELSEAKILLNNRLLATHCVAQTALWRLKNVWRIIQGNMWRPDKNKLPRIIFVCCILHNIIVDMKDEVLDELPLFSDHDPGYRQVVSKSVDMAASVTRDKLSLYLSGKMHP